MDKQAEVDRALREYHAAMDGSEREQKAALARLRDLAQAALAAEQQTEDEEDRD